MRILVVAMLNSIHTARWVDQIRSDDDRRIYAFPSTAQSASPALARAVLTTGLHPRLSAVARHVRRFVRPDQTDQEWRAAWLVKTIRRVRPDIIHSLEFQHAGYLCLAARQALPNRFPIWIATNWGSDIYLFSQLKSHRDAITRVLTAADFYSAECARDYELARHLGMTAVPLPLIPNAGGLHLDSVEVRRRQPPSRRNLILIKGYQMTFGRALTALRAIEAIADRVRARQLDVCVLSATPDLMLAIELLASRTGLRVDVVPVEAPLPHEQVLDLHARARCYVGISISDGISTSMLEAMALGAFPIQTCTSCANEWIEDGVTGFVVPSYDDPAALATLIARAIDDDELVDTAAARNWETIKKRAGWDHVRQIAKCFYDAAYREAVERRRAGSTS